ncbi:hypothetical protein [Shimia sp. SDUM112013]|uniref:hypothetical protein n=1 Tax=Shimia sp. SDUM112013 TaxID=3136160 RepID=UPI0032EA9D73
MRILSALILTALIAGCGADGEPWAPSMNANIGISSGGVYTSANVGVSKGPVSISVGRGCSTHGCW